MPGNKDIIVSSTTCTLRGGDATIGISIIADKAVRKTFHRPLFEALPLPDNGGLSHFPFRLQVVWSFRSRKDRGDGGSVSGAPLVCSALQFHQVLLHLARLERAARGCPLVAPGC